MYLVHVIRAQYNHRPTLQLPQSMTRQLLRVARRGASGLVSKRGAAAPLLLPTYLSDARGVERFDPVSAPDGVLQLSVAENQMLADMLVPKIRAISASDGGLFEQSMIYYQPTHGVDACRTAVASHMDRVLARGEYAFAPDKLVIGAGCNAVLENLLFAIADPGEGVLIPRPCGGDRFFSG